MWIFTIFLEYLRKCLKSKDYIKPNLINGPNINNQLTALGPKYSSRTKIAIPIFWKLFPRHPSKVNPIDVRPYVNVQNTLNTRSSALSTNLKMSSKCHYKFYTLRYHPLSTRFDGLLHAHEMIQNCLLLPLFRSSQRQEHKKGAIRHSEGEKNECKWNDHVTSHSDCCCTRLCHMTSIWAPQSDQTPKLVPLQVSQDED